MPDDTFYCPICGEANKPNAKSCRGCGADERTGFREDFHENEYQDGDYHREDDFNYDEFVEKEFGESRPKSPRERITTIAAAVLILILIFFLVLR